MNRTNASIGPIEADEPKHDAARAERRRDRDGKRDDHAKLPSAKPPSPTPKGADDDASDADIPCTD